MPFHWPWAKRPGGEAVPAEKKSTTGFVALHIDGEAHWTRRDFAALSREGFLRNPVVHRCVRLLAETASAVPWLLYEGEAELTEHPLLALLDRPNQRQSGPSFLQALYGYLLLSGNAYLELVTAGGAKELHLLRPDRVRVLADRAGWPTALEYRQGSEKRVIPLEGEGEGSPSGSSEAGRNAEGAGSTSARRGRRTGMRVPPGSRRSAP